MRRAFLLMGLVISNFAAAGPTGSAPPKSIYLQCKSDLDSLKHDPMIVIDLEKRTIATYPLKEGLPLLDDEASYSGQIVIDGKVQVRLTVNRYTLRYYSFASFIREYESTGQCKVVEQQI